MVVVKVFVEDIETGELAGLSSEVQPGNKDPALYFITETATALAKDVAEVWRLSKEKKTITQG